MSTVNFKYENGDELVDIVTGFTGIVMVRAEYSTGCVHYGLQAQTLKDGQPTEWHWLDQARLERKAKSVVGFTVDSRRPSGPFPTGPEA